MEDKEFEASKKKLKQARKEGKVVHSQELALGLLFLCFFSLLWLVGPSIITRIKLLMSFQHLNSQDPLHALFHAVSTLKGPLFLFLIAMFLAAYFVHAAQIGLLFSRPKKHKTKIRPLFPLVKLLIISLILYLFLKKPSSISFIFFLLSIVISLLILGIIDYFYQRYLFFKEMRMSRAEKKEEQREDCTKQ